MDVFNILTRCAERSGWVFEADEATLLSSLPCRTGTIHHVRTTTVGDLAVKVCIEHWTPDDARSAFEVLDTVGKLLGNEVDVSVPHAYGWDDRVPAVCMSWVDGASLRSLLESNKDRSQPTRITDAAAGCGRALGLLHAGTLSPLSKVRPKRYRTSGHDGRAGDARSGRRIRPGRRNRFLVLRGPGSTPQNVLVGVHGHITLVDSPRLRRLVSPHRALAKFLAQAFADIARSGSLRDHSGSKVARFERAFLESYARSGPAVLHTRSSMRLLALHRARVAIGLVGPTLRSQRPREAVRLVGHATRLLLRSIYAAPLNADAAEG